MVHNLVGYLMLGVMYAPISLASLPPAAPGIDAINLLSDLQKGKYAVSQLEWEISPALKRKLIKRLKQGRSFGFKSLKLKKNHDLDPYKIIDVNSDGKLDLISEHPGIGVQVWLNDDKFYKLAYEKQYGNLKYMRINGATTTLVVERRGEGCFPELLLEYCVFQDGGTTPQIQNIVSCSMSLAIPKPKFFRTFDIKTGILRKTPEKDDVLRPWECDDAVFIKGNIIVEYKEVIECLCIDDFEDKNGDQWFFVIARGIEDRHHPQRHYAASPHTISLGWISANLGD